MSNQSKLAALASTGVTKAELNNIDGGTARGTTAVADGDGFLTNDGGTMRMTKVDTLATYMGTKIGGGMEFIASSGAISNAANVSFTQFDATKYDHYKFIFQYVIPATDSVGFFGYASTDGGSNYDTTNGNYHVEASTDQPGFVIVAGSVGSDTNEFGLSGEATLFAPHLTTYTYMRATPIFMHSNGGGIILGAEVDSVKLAAEDTDAIQFAFSSGNIESGEITMFGIVNS